MTQTQAVIPKLKYCVGKRILTSYRQSFTNSLEECIYVNAYARVATMPTEIEYKITPKMLHNSLKKQSGNITLYDSAAAAQQANNLEEREVIHGETYTYQRPIFAVYVVDPTPPTTSANNLAVASLEPIGEPKEKVLYNPQSYYAFFKSSDNSQQQTIASIKTLIKDYAHPVGGWFFSFHWFRHHRKLADKIAREIPNTTKGAYTYLLKQRQQLIENHPKLNMDGSFMRRVNFALAELANLENTHTTAEATATIAESSC